MALLFLTLPEVLAIHRRQIERRGGDPGIRDLGLLESAIAMPQAGFGGEYLHGDIFEMAAAYLFHIVMNHPFLDSNKRAGVATSFIFLEMNGFDVNVKEDEMFELVLSMIRGETDKAAFAAFFRKHSRK